VPDSKSFTTPLTSLQLFGIVCCVQDESYGPTPMINISNTITSTGEYRSVLKVTNAYYLDTGYYYCIVNGTIDFNNALEDVTHVYVYVKGKQKIQISYFSQLEVEKY
jgi:hypothetical protein